ncbi:MAG TPA: glycerate kinase [Solirubrobacterales bacterium]|nr:glycerate kinase [Solirubrobacterales bacterium]
MGQPLRFLVAPDSFKGTIDAPEVARAIAAGLAEAGAEADLCPVADGGEGTAAALRAALGGSVREAASHDPLGRPLEASFVLLDDGETAVVDTAAASGLPLLAPAERDAEAASTYGTGELIAAAIEVGARTVILAAGGSATTDGGAGATRALRERGGLRGARIEVLCDVETKFEDAARVFGPQKGADEAAVARLDARLQALAAELPRDPRGVPMTGCAGGLSGGLWAAFDAGLRSGAEYVLELLGFERRLREAGAAISGEGRIDSQSLEGKIVGQIARACARAGLDLYVLVGRDALDRAAIGELPIRAIEEAGTVEALGAAAAAIARNADSPTPASQPRSSPGSRRSGSPPPRPPSSRR